METGRKKNGPNLQGLRQRVALVVEGDEALAAAAEGDLVVAVVPPVVERRAGDDVAELDHVGDLTPAVLAAPVAQTGAVRVERRTQDVVAAVVGRAHPVVLVL